MVWEVYEVLSVLNHFICHFVDEITINKNFINDILGKITVA